MSLRQASLGNPKSSDEDVLLPSSESDSEVQVRVPDDSSEDVVIEVTLASGRVVSSPVRYSTTNSDSSLDDNPESPIFDRKKVKLVINTNRLFAQPEITDEAAPLLASNPVVPSPQPKQPKGWFRRTVSGAYNKLKEIVTHPISSLLGLGTAVQPAISGLVNASHTDPEKISTEWWHAMDTKTQALSITNMFFSLWVNFPVNSHFIASTRAKLKESTKDILRSPKHFIDNISSLYFGLASGVGAGAITFNSVLFLVVILGGGWYGYIPAVVLSGLSFLAASTSRYIGLKRLFHMVVNFFNHDARVQNQSIDALKHLNLDYSFKLAETEATFRTHLENWLRELRAEKPENLTERHYEELFAALAEKISSLQRLHPENLNFFNQKQWYEYCAEYAGVLVNLSFAITFGLSAGGVFLQKGYDGINILAKLFSKDLDSLDNWKKLLIGSSCGIGSGLLYGASAAEFPQLFFVTLPTYLYHNPSQIAPTLLFLIVPNYFASSSMEAVAEGVVKQPNNILMLPEWLKTSMPFLVRAGCIPVNTIPFLRDYKPQVVDPHNPTVADLIQHFSDPNTHLMTADMVSKCSIANEHYSFFRKLTIKPSPSKDELRDSRDDVPGAFI